MNHDFSRLSGGLANNPSMFFSGELWVRRKRKVQTNGWKIKMQIDTFQYRYTPQVFSVKSFAQQLRWQLKNVFFNIYFTLDGHANTIISRRACMIIWCPECQKKHFRTSRFQNFLGKHAPRPPQVKGADSPLFIQLPTSNFIECILILNKTQMINAGLF